MQSEADLPTGELELELKRVDLALRRQQLVLAKEAHDRGKWTNPLLVGILAAFLAAMANLWVSKANAASAAALDRAKWEQSRKDEHARSAAAAVSEFARHMASAYQEASWVLWRRLNDPDRFALVDVETYDRALKGLLPAILSSHVQIATLDPELHRDLAPLVQEIAQADAKVALLIGQSPTKRVDRSLIAAEHVEINRSLEKLGPRIAKIYVERQAPAGELALPVRANSAPPRAARP